MRCASCGEPLLPGKKFCHGCGAPAAGSCPHCGSSVEARFSFCPDCGGSLSAGAEAARSAPTGAPAPRPGPEPTSEPQAPRPTGAAYAAGALAVAGRAGTGAWRTPIAGERKQVTVLFCDLAGSTAIAEGMDPEEYRDLLDRYLELAIREIDRLGGMVNQLAGDGFMALFGAPIAHEDAPERAVRAALGIQDALEELNRERSRRDGVVLRARIGIHTGPVVVGTVGNDLKMDYTAIGDTTNLAARLQELAEPGTVRISASTENLVAGRFELRELAAVEVKGKTEPIRAFEVIRASAGVTPMAIAKARGLTPLVGFDAELAQLDACFERLGQSLSQVVSIVGDPGSGKSRLVFEFKRRLAERDATVLEARASALSQSVPFAPLTNLLKDLFSLGPGEDRDCACEKIAGALVRYDSDLSTIYPPLCQLLTQPEEGAAVNQREHIMEALNKLFGHMCHEQPLVLVFEDLHWFDEASLEVLNRAVSRMDHWPILLVATHRPDFEPRWRIRAAHTRLPLRPLSDEQAAEIARARAGGTLPAAVEQKIVKRAGGNPFFVEEITRALLEGGQLVRSDGELRLAGGADSIRIPHTVQELIEARLDRLSPEAKRTAQVAAVFGRQFRADQLARLLADEGLDPAPALAELQQRGLVHQISAERDEYRFGESLTQSVCYEGLLLRERRTLHGRIAAMIEADPRGMTAERAGLVAHHLARGENRARAIEGLIAAAKSAEDLPSYPSAAKLYREAWDLAERLLADEGDEAARRRVIETATGVARIAVLYTSRDPRDEERAAARVIELARELGDTGALSLGLSLKGVLVMGGDATRFEEGLPYLEEGLRIAKEAGDVLRTVAAQRSLSWTYVRDGRFEDARAALQEIRETLIGIGQHDPPSDLFLSIGFFRAQTAFYEGQLTRAWELAKESHEACVTANNRTLASGSMSLLAQAHFALGEYEEARDWADRALELGREIGSVGATCTGATVGLMARRELGEPAPTSEFLAEIDESYEAGDISLVGGMVAEALVELGELDRARRCVDGMALRAGGRLRQVQCMVATGTVLLGHGSSRVAEAAAEFELARKVAGEIGCMHFVLASRLGLAQVAALNGETEAARAELESLAAEAQAAGQPRLAELALRERRALPGAEPPADTIPSQLH